jgi:hypothetical protein
LKINSLGKPQEKILQVSSWEFLRQDVLLRWSIFDWGEIGVGKNVLHENCANRRR